MVERSGRIRAMHGTILEDMVGVAVYDGGIGSGHEGSGDGLERLWHVRIVRVEPADDLSASERHPLVHGIGLAVVGLGHPPESVSVRLEDVDSAVGRPAVDHDELEVGIAFAVATG